MSENTMNLLSMDQQAYLLRILNDREFFRSKGKKYVSVEKDWDGGYKVYLLDSLIRGSLDLEIVEYIEL